MLFLNVPVHKDSQYWFAFNFENKAYTFRRLCQGYCEPTSLLNLTQWQLALHKACVQWPPVKKQFLPHVTS